MACCSMLCVGLAFLDRSLFLRSFKPPRRIQSAVDWMRKQLPHLDPKDLLPLGLHISKGAIVIGNASTPNLLVADFKTAKGNFGVVQARSRFDLYKQILSLAFQKVLIHYVSNGDYREPMVETGQGLGNHIMHQPKPPQRWPLSYSTFARIWKVSRLYQAFFSKKARKPYRDRNIKLESKKKHSIDEAVDPSTHEYAIERRIIEAPAFELSYYADVVGDVPRSEENPQFRSFAGETDIGNGDIPPEWGIDMVIRRGIVRYGPWADRQRVELQRAFFPASYQNNQVTHRLKPGDKRQWTDMRIFVELRDETTLETSFRESSKNWQWDGLSHSLDRPRKREAALLYLKAGDRSSIRYVLPMVVQEFGYESSLEVHLDTIVVTSSLNDIRLVTAESCRVRCALPTPIVWNAHREWTVSVSLRQPLLFLLRDHINMFTDLGKDWASGPPTDYFRFVPTTYKVDIQMVKFIANLYCNDLNLVDKPLTKEENTLMILHGDQLRTNVEIPSHVYRPEFTDVTFQVNAPNISCDFALPRWHTHFMPNPQNVAHIGRFALDGSFLYYAAVHEDNIDRLRLVFSVQHVAYKALGWTIRHFMLFQANYFGSYTHYTTLTEFLKKVKTPGRRQTIGDPIDDRFPAGKIELEVDLGHGIISYEKSEVVVDDLGTTLFVDVSELQVHLRLHDHFMEMSLNASPMSISIESQCPSKISYRSCRRTRQNLLILDSLDIVANRLFGPLPRTTTYVCIWEVSVGDIHGSMSASEGQVFASVGQSFKTSFSDIINAPAAEFQAPSIPDVTFLKVVLGHVDLVWNAGRAALAVRLQQGLALDNNDIAGLYHKKITSIRLPQLTIKVLVDKGSAGAHWLEAGEVALDANMDIYSAPPGWHLKAFEQTKLVEREDSETHRFQRIFAQHAQGKQQFSQSGRDPRFLSSSHTAGMQSDSDVEDSIAQAERDARIALLRTITPRPDPANEEQDAPLSTGDETDDADLSDGSDSSDYDSDEETMPPLLLKRFARVSKSYKCHHLKSPGIWVDGPFSVLRDSKPIKIPAWHADTLPHLPTEIPSSKLPFADDDDDADTTVFRIRSHKGIRVKTSPLLLWSTLQFERDMENMDTSPELFLDHLLARTLGKASQDKTGIASHTFLDLQVPQIRFHILQDVTLPEEVFLNSKPVKDESQPFPAIVVLQSELREFRFKAQLSPQCRTIGASIQSVSLNLSTAVSERMTPFSSGRAAFSFYLSDFVLSLAHDAMKLTWTELATQLSHHGPEYILAFSKTGMRSLKPARLAVRKWASFKKTADENALRTILLESSHHVDRLSIIQPSFLVQHDVPKYLREDPEFRLLFALREGCNGLRDSAKIHTVHDESTEESVSSLLISRLDRFVDISELHEHHFVAISPFLPRFPDTTGLSDSPDDGAHVRKPLFLSLHMQRLVVTILDPSGGTGGRALLENLDVRLRSLTRLLQSEPGNWSHDSDLQRYSKSLARLSAATKPSGEFTNLPRAFDLQVNLGSASLRAIAATLTIEFGFSTAQLVTSWLLGTSSTRLGNTSLLFTEVFVHARNPQSRRDHSDVDILASLILSGGKLNNTFDAAASKTTQGRAACSFAGLDFRVPRSALKLYRFATEWQESFLPAIESAAQELMAELRSANSPSPSPKPEAPSITLHVLFRLAYLRIALQVMPATWLSWDINDSLAYADASNVGKIVTVRAAESSVIGPYPETRLKLALPAISVKGRYTSNGLSALALVDFITVTVKPSHWDTFLAVQQKFGQDFNDLVSLIQETRTRHSQMTSSKMKTTSPGPRFQYNVFFKMRGFRLGLRAVASAGVLDNERKNKWRLAVTDLALSLVPRAQDSATQLQEQATFMREYKSAFVNIDFQISSNSAFDEGNRSNSLILNVSKVHAVMQPTSVSEFGDFADHLQAEILKRQDERKAALREFKEKTQNVLKTFDVKLPDVKEVRKPTLLNEYTIDIGIHDIGVAFPLAHDLPLQWPSHADRATSPVRAFLFSIQSIRFSTHLEALSLQFVHRFRQTVAEDFRGENHRHINRLFYPSMQAQLRSKATENSRQLWVNCRYFIFSLIDVYRQGKERVDRFNQMAGSPKAVAKPAQQREPSQELTEMNNTVSHILGSLTFQSGRIRIHNGGRSHASLGKIGGGLRSGDGLEIFSLPEVSVFAEYQSSLSLGEPAMLVFKSTVHSSQNTLTPEILPFMSAMFEIIERRLRTTSAQATDSPESSVTTLDVKEEPTSGGMELPFQDSSLQISFGLRIDQSKLQLSCQPDVNVIAGVHWDSGGFIVNMSPGARRVAFTGTVGGLTVRLKHGFLTEDCLRLDMRNLAFSITFSRSEIERARSMPTVSVVVQTELHGVARFSRLQDILCFKAVWLDRIPTLNARATTQPTSLKSPSSHTSLAEQGIQPFLTTILVRISHIQLQIDLGHSITTTTLDLRDAVLRTKLTESVNDVSVYLDDLSVAAKGNIAGQLNVSNCVFASVRRAESVMSTPEATQMLEIVLTSSALTASMESEHQRLLHYRAEPLMIRVFDDWSGMTARPLNQVQPLLLSFTVAGPEIVAVITVGTIPVLLKYANIFKANLATQREAASRESKTFHAGTSARNRMQETASSYVMQQHISLGLNTLRLVVYPRTIGDLEAAELLAMNVLAELDGTEDSSTKAERQLHLSFTSMSISKYARTTTLPAYEDSDGKGWLDALHKGAFESNIVGLPAMDMHMKSEETRQGDQTSIVYDFDSRFLRAVDETTHSLGQHDDIFITLNMSLYVWLTSFRKAFQRGMEEAEKAKLRTIANAHGPIAHQPLRPKALQVHVPGHGRAFDGPKTSALAHSPPSLMVKTAIPHPSSRARTAIGGDTFRTATGDETLASPDSDGQSPTDRNRAGTVPSGVSYTPRNRRIERLTMRQLGEATPDLTHPFFKKTAGFTLEDSLPQLVHEYATVPLEQIMETLLKLYIRQLLSGQR
ncbi:hypothetical protein DL96DRAFT_1601498 [Flagelloscypha sp. PMI_526]|nr:hypothetical protein DL96DRAFT_1601498 [Flagelloscypha sp. PMI_526]